MELYDDNEYDKYDDDDYEEYNPEDKNTWGNFDDDYCYYPPEDMNCIDEIPQPINFEDYAQLKPNLIKTKIKLVRDKIPCYYKDDEINFWQLDKDSPSLYIERLIEKLLEESKELEKSSQKEAFKELADLCEIIFALRKLLKIGWIKLIGEIWRKRKENGGFTQRWVTNNPEGLKQAWKDKQSSKMMEQYKWKDK